MRFCGAAPTSSAACASPNRTPFSTCSPKAARATTSSAARRKRSCSSGARQNKRRRRLSSVLGSRHIPGDRVFDRRSPSMPAIPEQYLDLFTQKKAFANLATVMPDGTPQVTPVWFDLKDGVVRVNTAKGRVKARNMREGAPVALAIMDPDNAYRYVQLRGRVRRVTEEGAGAH